MLLTDEHGVVQFINRVAMDLLEKYETKIQEYVPHFSCFLVTGFAVEDFFPALGDWQRKSESTQQTFEIALGDVYLKFRVRAVTSETDKTKVKGYCLEIEDQTTLILSQKKIQQLIELAAQGDLTKRMNVRRLVWRTHYGQQAVRGF